MADADSEDVYRPTAHTSHRIRTGLERAREDARAFEDDPARALAGARTRAAASARGPASLAVAMGDPQAPLARVLEVLDRHDLLSDDGAVHGDAALVSMGDHFDWGAPEQRPFAAESGYALLAWLAAQPEDRVTILVGNHDLARVGELAPFDDATFAAARDEARALRGIRIGTPGRAERRQAFLARYPSLPSVGVAVRDLSTFEARQRDLVRALLEGGRMRAAKAAAPDLLLIHAAITPDDLDSIGFPEGAARADAFALERAIGERFERAIEGWDGASSLAIAPLYLPGDARHGESRGVFVQRPADPAVGELPLFEGPPRRRFDPRMLTPGLSQVTGHIRDQKCRDLMPVWSDDEPARDGPLRHLWTDGRRVRYRSGLPAGDEAGALLLFADGGMNHAAPADYELLDLRTRRALPRAGA
ncbi:MAG: transcriptional regulator [Candidatus Eisenbacteria bacterium]